LISIFPSIDRTSKFWKLNSKRANRTACAQDGC
jgi:hypothetical protein